MDVSDLLTGGGVGVAATFVITELWKAKKASEVKILQKAEIDAEKGRTAFETRLEGNVEKLLVLANKQETQSALHASDIDTLKANQLQIELRQREQAIAHKEALKEQGQFYLDAIKAMMPRPRK